MKTILVHCDGSPSVVHRLAVATDIAGRFDASLSGVYAKAPFQPPLFVGKAYDMAAMFHAYERGAMNDKEAARLAFHKAIETKSVPSEWRARNGSASEVLARCSAYADLVIVGQTERSGSQVFNDDLPEAVAFTAGRPVLVVPYAGARRPVGETVLLCWNGSRESARAAADALPFLKAAKKVVVLMVDPMASTLHHDDETGARIAGWLARHGVKSTVQRDAASDADVGETILSRAAGYDVDLIVMGIYGHSRMRETVLGGVSRTMLSSMNVPVLMSH
jgi:nucleotide-binding universal stress UspA family protein